MYEKLKNPDHIIETKAEFIELLESFIEGAEEGKDCVAIYFELPGLTEPEIIVNPIVNVPKKLEYYGAAYNDEMKLNNNNAVKVIGVSFL